MTTPSPILRFCRAALCAVATFVVVAPVVVTAQVGPGSIGVYSDAAGGDCNVVDTASFVNVEIVLVGGDGAAYVWFAVEESPGVQMTYLTETVHQPLKLGSSRSGIQIGFGACLSGAVHLMTLRYSGTGTTTTCEGIRVVPHPGRPSGLVDVMDCTQQIFGTDHGGTALVRNDGGCSCSVGAEDSTWGRVKSLYR